MRRGHPAAELDVAAQVELVGDEVEIAQGLGLAGEMLRPAPFLQELRREGVAVRVAFGVEARARIAVPVPGAADAGAGLEDPHAQPQLAQPIELAQARHARPDDDDVVVQDRGRPGTGFMRGGHGLFLVRGSSGQVIDRTATLQRMGHRKGCPRGEGERQMRMKDKVGIVTAAGSGMGRAGALRFAREGAAVGVVDIDAASVAAVVGEIMANGGKARGIVADLRQDAEARRIVRETASAFGGLDFVWNHLGHPGPAAVEGIEMADFELAVDLNLRSQIVTTEAALPELRARGGGSLLFTASTSGLAGSQFSPVYSAVKFGVVGFVRALAKRVAKDGIRVNAICPGATDTPMLRVFVARPDQQSTPRHGPGGAGPPACRPEPHGPPGASGGNGERRAISAVGRGLVRHRRGAAGRRRHDRVGRSHWPHCKSLVHRRQPEPPK